MLEDAGVHDVPVVAVSKGPDRNAGREIFHLPGGREISFPPNAPVLFYLQRLRDEAHRFAIGAHRAKRAKSFTASPLDEVPGIGPGRKRALLMHFGTARAVRNAALQDLEKAPGISADGGAQGLRLLPSGGMRPPRHPGEGRVASKVSDVLHESRPSPG